MELLTISAVLPLLLLGSLLGPECFLANMTGERGEGKMEPGAKGGGEEVGEGSVLVVEGIALHVDVEEPSPAALVYNCLEIEQPELASVFFIIN